MSIISPNSDTPVLRASAAASVVPAMTGVPLPLVKPVFLAALAVTLPTILQLHYSFAKRLVGVIYGAISSHQRKL